MREIGHAGNRNITDLRTKERVVSKAAYFFDSPLGVSTVGNPLKRSELPVSDIRLTLRVYPNATVS